MLASFRNRRQSAIIVWGDSVWSRCCGVESFHFGGRELFLVLAARSCSVPSCSPELCLLDSQSSSQPPNQCLIDYVTYSKYCTYPGQWPLASPPCERFKSCPIPPLQKLLLMSRNFSLIRILKIIDFSCLFFATFFCNFFLQFFFATFFCNFFFLQKKNSSGKKYLAARKILIEENFLGIRKYFCS